MASFDLLPTLEILDFLGTDRPEEAATRFASTPTMTTVLRRFEVAQKRGPICLDMVSDPTSSTPRSAAEGLLISHLSLLRERDAELRELLKELQHEEEIILERAFSRTREFLPRSTPLGEVSVVFVPLGYDARVDSNTVYFDPLLALLIGREGVTQFLSHELHHVGRFRMTGDNLSGMDLDLGARMADHRTFVRFWVSLLEMEGIADQIFDLAQLQLPVHRARVEERKRVKEQYAEHLSHAQDALLERGEKGTVPRQDLAPIASQVLENVHPLGARLAGDILGTLGKERLVEGVGRPERFLDLYQEVARSKGLFEFDPYIVTELSAP